jgi:translation elongation factor EF-4
LAKWLTWKANPLGKVEIPQEAFIAALKMGDE